MTCLCAATYKSVLPWSSSAISFGVILPYPSLAWLLLWQPPMLFRASFLAMLLVCPGLPWSASTLATALLTTAQVRLYSSLALYLTGFVLHVLLWPFLSSAEQTCPGIPLTCRGSDCPTLTLLTLLYPHCSFLTPNSIRNCVRTMAWLF